MIDPLPSHYLTDTPGIGGRFKVEPDDFIVDEEPSYHPCGEGEHLYLFIEKRGLEHRQLVQILRRHFDVPERSIGYAGMKDKQSVARQQLSIHLPGRTDRDISLRLNDDRLNILSADWHRNKLRRGHLRSNRFTVRIRDVSATDTPRALETMRIIEKQGIPAWFDAQRFGRYRNNHLVGAAMLRGDWDGAARELVGLSGTTFPDDEQERRQLFEDGRYHDAARLWSPRSAPEARILNVLARGESMEKAVRSMGRNPMGFYMNACQSAVFNAVVDARLESRTLGELNLGDLAWVHTKGSVFNVTDEELASPELGERLQRMELSPSGPLWGRNMTMASGETRDAEVAALNRYGLNAEDLGTIRNAPDGGRRPLRIPVTNVELSGGVDSDGGYIAVAFDLPPGAYATIVLRELMKNEELIPGSV